MKKRFIYWPVSCDEENEMLVIRNIDEIKSALSKEKSLKKIIGYVPTMGYLHEGHMSLIKKAKENNDVVVVSIYVNPTQFGPDEDLDNYPRDLERDSKICEDLGVDYIFHPSDDTMYPNGFSTFVTPSEKMTNILCGVSRPIHFRGVCTVLSKFFNILSPDNAYFGEKDIQQLAIVKRMVKDMNFDVCIHGCPIVREDDGLAKSSRNVYLNEDERSSATVLRRSILEGVKMVEDGEKNTSRVLSKIVEIIESEKLAKIDYVEILDFDTFDRIEEIKDNTLIAMAVYIGKTRLIDNYLINID